MGYYEKVVQLKKYNTEMGMVKRILSQLEFAAELSHTKNGQFDKVVEKAADILLEGINKDGTLTNNTCMDAETVLLKMKDAAKAYTVHCVSHAHIDMNWMWGYQETASVTVDTFRTVLDLMAEYPEFTFAQSQASTYKIIEDYAPEMLEEIKKYVKEGRFEVCASTWVETDKNMPSGESLARHILYTKRYLSKLLDISPESLEIDFEPDTFGHNISVPEICKKGGVKYYYHCRGYVDDPMRPVHRWRSRGGEELLVWRDPQWYNFSVAPSMFYKVPELCDYNGISDFLYVYGVGDHGGGPTRRDVSQLIEISSWPVMPEIKFSTYTAFFKELEKSRENFPILEGEMNFVFTGCYTSESEIKMSNRISEDRMYESEELSAMANIFAGRAKKNTSFETAWRRILFNQFHDILPGSGVVDTREYAMGEFQKAMAAIGTNANTAMRAIAENINTSAYEFETKENSVSEGAGVGYGTDRASYFRMPITERGNGKKRVFHLFNTTGYDFDGVCELIVWDWNYNAGHAVFKNSKGEKCEHQLLEGGNGYWDHEYKKFALYAKIPAFGYATCSLDECPERNVPGYSLLYPRIERETEDDIILENNKVKAVFSSNTMEMLSLFDKENSKELLDAPSGYFSFIKENTLKGMTAWRVGVYLSEENINKQGNVKVTARGGGALSSFIKYEMPLGERSKMTVLVKLVKNSKIVEFDAIIDFHEIGVRGQFIPGVAFTAPFGYTTKKVRYDVPFGVIDRAPISHDVPTNSFALPINENGAQGGNVFVISDSRYGFRTEENRVSVKLLRASYDPDPYPEYGVHRIRLGIGVTNTEDPSELYKMRDFFVHAPAVCSARKGKSGTLPLDGALFKISENVQVSAVKNPEDSEGLVIRIFEAKGEDGKYTVEFNNDIKEAYLTDINENPCEDLPFEKNKITGDIGKYSIKTLLVKF